MIEVLFKETQVKPNQTIRVELLFSCESPQELPHSLACSFSWSGFFLIKGEWSDYGLTYEVARSNFLKGRKDVFDWEGFWNV